MTDYNVSISKFSRTAKILDVLKIIPLTDKSRCGHFGNVSFHLDSNIYKNVCQIMGRVSASNRVVLPSKHTKNPKREVRSLKISERYLYVQLRSIKGRQCTLHFDLTTNRQITVTITLSTIFKEVKATSNNIHIPITMTNRWTIFCIDFVDILKRFLPNERQRHLKRITLCSNLLVSGIFAADTRFNCADLPKKMNLLRRNGKHWRDLYTWQNIPALVGGALKNGSKNLLLENKKKEDKNSKNNRARSSDFRMVISRTGTNPLHNMQTPIRRQTSDAGAGAGAGTLSGISNHGSPAPSASVLAKVMRGSTYSSSHISRAFTANRGSPTKKLRNNIDGPPALTLDHVTAISSSRAAGAWWFDQNKSIIFPSGNIVVVQNINPTTHASANKPSMTSDAINAASGDSQRFLIGHTSPIVALCVGELRRLIVSAQDGPVPNVRIWDADKLNCLALIMAPASGVTSLALSSDETHLCISGCDEQNRQQIFVWDISRVSAKGVIDRQFSKSSGSCLSLQQSKVGSGSVSKPPSLLEVSSFAQAARIEMPYSLVAKQMSEFSINHIQFLPGSNGLLISCGSENIRLWRVRECHLRGRPVILHAELRKADFLDISFEKCKADALMASTSRRTPPRAFIACSLGHVVVVNANRASVDAAFQVHSAAVTAVSVNEGYCVTASNDKSLKVWPLDFSDFFLQAPHEGNASRVSISDNGLQVLVDSAEGTLGILHIASQKFVSVMRSHSNTIHAVAIAENVKDNEIVVATTSADHTIRIWSLATMTQLYEFTLSGYLCRCLMFEPAAPTGRGAAGNGGARLICGFDSGHVRVLDVSSTSLVKEMHETDAPISCVACLPNGTRFFALDTDGILCVFSCTHVNSVAAVSASSDALVEETGSNEKDFQKFSNGTADGGYRFIQKTTIFERNNPTHLRQPQDLSLIASATSRVIACACADTPKVLLLWSDSLDVLSYLTCPTKISCGAGFTALSFDPLGQHISAASMSRGIITWSVGDGTILRHIPSAHNHRCQALCMAPSKYKSDGGVSTQLSVSVDTSGTVSAWTCGSNAQESPFVASGEPLRQQFIGHNGCISDVAMGTLCSTGETYIVSVGTNQIIRWRVNSDIVDDLNVDGANASENNGESRQSSTVDRQQAALIQALDRAGNDTAMGVSNANDEDESWAARRAALQQKQRVLMQEHQAAQTDMSNTLPTVDDEKDQPDDGSFVELVSNIEQPLPQQNKGETLDLSRGGRLPEVKFGRLAVVGFTGQNGFCNLLWNGKRGVIISSCGGLLVADDLASNTQHLCDVGCKFDNKFQETVSTGKRNHIIRGITANDDASLIAIESIPKQFSTSKSFQSTTLSLYRFLRHPPADNGAGYLEHFEHIWSTTTSCVGAPLAALEFSRSENFLLYALANCGIFVKDIASGSTVGTVFLSTDPNQFDESLPESKLLVKWLTPSTLVRIFNDYRQRHYTCYAEIWDVAGSHALQLTKRPYRIQLDMKLQRPGAAVACAIDTDVTFEGEDKVVVVTSDGMINVFTDVSAVKSNSSESSSSHDFLSAMQSKVASTIAIKPTCVISVLAPVLGNHQDVHSFAHEETSSIIQKPSDRVRHITGVRWCRNGMYLVSTGSSLFRVSSKQASQLSDDDRVDTDLTAPAGNFNKVDFDADITTFSFGSDADRGVVSTTRGTLWFVEWSAGSLVRLTSSHATGIRALRSIPATPKRPGLVCSAGGPDGSVRVWAASRPTGGAASAFSLQQLLQFEVKNISCSAVAMRELKVPCTKIGLKDSRESVNELQSEGKVFAAAGYSNGTVRIFNVSNIKMTQKFALETGNAEITAIGLISLDATDDNGNWCPIFAVICGTKDGHLIYVPLVDMQSHVSSQERNDTRPLQTTQSVLMRAELIDTDLINADGGGILCLEVCNMNPALWLACNTAGHLSVWHGEDIRYHVNLDAISQASSRNQLNTRTSSFGKRTVVFSPVDADVVLVSARSVPPLVLAYHLTQKCVLYTMALKGWPRPLHSFIAPPYPAPVIALVSSLGTAKSDQGTLSRHSRLLSLLDLQTGKEVPNTRHFIHGSTESSATVVDEAVHVAFGCNAAQGAIDQTILMGHESALHVFGNVFGSLHSRVDSSQRQP